MEKRSFFQSTGSCTRREFTSSLTKLAGSSILVSEPFRSITKTLSRQAEQYTVGQVIDLFIKEVPGSPFDKTVDTLKAGNLDIKITGILTTAFATIENIRKAINIGANFIIVHEPTYYSHADNTDWLKIDEVYKYKSALLKKHNIAVWRNHDYIHAHNPDGVMEGVLEALGWEKFKTDERQIFKVPEISLKDLLIHTKQKLNAGTIRYVGNLNQSCEKILLIPGAAGGSTQIKALIKYKPDVLIIGETSEWETVEYVRDANTKGDKLGLIILGHIASEDIGSKWMAEWLMRNTPGIKVTHIPTTKSLSYF